MQITTSYNQPQFKSSTFANLTKVIPNTKVCKNLTPLDINCFRAYTYAMKYGMKNNAEDIKNLFKLDGDNFVTATFSFIANKLGIDNEIMPEILTAEKDNPKAPMEYNITANFIVRNKDLSMWTKPQIFGFARHEIQHVVQIMNILCHETLGEKLVDMRVNNHLENLKNVWNLLLCR